MYELGRTVITVPTDVMTPDDIHAADAQADENVGRLDLLVINTGGVRSGRCVEQSERSGGATSTSTW
jgi:NADP-dependent 3-hydroxy acid dehydrogenase YdfG